MCCRCSPWTASCENALARLQYLIRDWRWRKQREQLNKRLGAPLMEPWRLYAGFNAHAEVIPVNLTSYTILPVAQSSATDHCSRVD
jgi:hypothetical protein